MTMTLAPSSTSSTASVFSTATQFSRNQQKRDKDEVRSRLLNKLGIFSCPTNSISNSLVTPLPTPSTVRKTNMLRGMGLGGVQQPPSFPLSIAVKDAVVRSRLASSAITSEPLKYKNEGYNASAKKPKPQKQRRGICFDDSVTIVPIPMRTEYSDRIRTRLWSNRVEIHENATRNAIEFQAEGWDWRTVTEDDGMFVCTVSGELVHPVHCQQYYDSSPILTC